MSAPTLAEMATWPAPNYVTPQTRVAAVKGVMVTFTALMIPFLIARLHTRLRLKGKLGADDFIIIFAAVCHRSKPIMSS
jgi:hypothetical protein